MRRRAQRWSPMPPGCKRTDGQPKECTSFQDVEGITMPSAQTDHSHIAEGGGVVKRAKRSTQ